MSRAARVRAGEATITVVISNERLAAAMTHAITTAARDAARAALGSAAARKEIASRVVHLRARRSVSRLSPALAGSIAIVAVTTHNARHLPELVELVRGAGVRGVQMVWDGVEPERARVERHVFAVLERARATSAGPPVVLSKSGVPTDALLMLIATRPRKDERRS